VALGTPAWTTFEGRPGAVDERLLAEGRLRRLRSPADLDVADRVTERRPRVRRDARNLLPLLLAPLA
jgi:hypothetical protein